MATMTMLSGGSRNLSGAPEPEGSPLWGPIREHGGATHATGTTQEVHGGGVRGELIGLLATDPAAFVARVAEIVGGSNVGAFQSGDTNNEAVEAVYAAMGYTAPARSATPGEMDRLARSKDHVVMVRGVTRPEYAGAVRDGDYYAGAGAYGSGIYAAAFDQAGLKVAADYSGGGGGSMTRLALPTSAKVVSSGAAWDKVLELAEATAPHIAALPPDVAARVDAVVRDIGFAAALMGADAVYGGNNSGTQYFTILNRSKLVTEDTDYAGGRGWQSRVPDPPRPKARSYYDWGHQEEVP